MVKVNHEIWETSDGPAMFVRGAKGWRETLKEPARLLHTLEAESVYEAFSIYYRLMGWGEWKPPPNFEDKPY